MDAAEVRELCSEAIDCLNLDLRGSTILTEAATGPFAATASLAALAGGRVLCLAQNSTYGSAEEAVSQTAELASQIGVAKEIKFVDRQDSAIKSVDIVTNLGNVRPLDKPLLSALGPNAVVALMFEKWEFRASDVDLDAAVEFGIPVAGTDESHHCLGTMKQVGKMAVKLVLDAGIDVASSKLILCGGRRFGDNVNAALSLAGAEVVRIKPGEMAQGAISESYEGVDAILIAEHEDDICWLGDGGLPVDGLPTLIHICGTVDTEALLAAGVKSFPGPPATFGHMTITPAYLGAKPVIDLHAGGLRVGQELLAARKKGADGLAAANMAKLNLPLVQPIG